jgi:hypothetical protein
MDRHVTSSETIQAGLDALLGSIYISMPGAIISYDPLTQLAMVQPLLADVRFDVDTDAPVYEPWDVLQGVKVMWPVFGGGFLAGNLKKNDPVTLCAWDFDPSGVTKPGTAVVNPNDVRKMGGNYWRAIPESLLPLPTAEATASAQGPILGIVGDPAQVRISAGSIQVGANATSFIALADLVTAELAKVVAALAGLQVTVPSGGGPNIPVISTSPYASAGNVAATIAKAQ